MSPIVKEIVCVYAILALALLHSALSMFRRGKISDRQLGIEE